MITCSCLLQVRLERCGLVSVLERLILQDSGRGMATDSVDSSVDIMECMVKIKRNLDRER